MKTIVFPTSGQYEESPCKGCESGEFDSQTLKGKTIVTCLKDDICNDLKDFKGLYGGDFEVQ